MPASASTLDWANIDTVLLDVDGTLLDLHYDNFVWDQRVPEAYADLKQLPLPNAKQQLMEKMRLVYGTIDFYSFDFWREQTGLDITDLHQQEAQRIRFRADAEAFLNWLAQSAHDAIIATNADHNSLRIKEEAIACKPTKPINPSRLEPTGMFFSPFALLIQYSNNVIIS